MKSLIVEPELRDYIPSLKTEERITLEKSVIEEGCREPLIVWGEVIVDGHNRYEICKENGVEFKTLEKDFGSMEEAKDWMDQNQLGRRNLSPDAFKLHLGNRYNRTKREQGGDRKSKAQVEPLKNTAEELAKEHGVSRETVKRAGKFADEVNATPELKEAIAENKPVLQVKRELKEAKKEEKRQENREKIEKAEKPSDIIAKDVKFSTIVMDPPWDWGDEGDQDQLGRAKPDYSTMSIEQLMELPVPDFAEDDCHLYMWITNRSLPKGFALLEKWGFRYITALTWVKPSFGMGNYFRGQTEHVLFGVKGSQMLKRKNASTLFEADRGKDGHSSKPQEFQELVESCSHGPYLEMFSRTEREGWTTWGENS